MNRNILLLIAAVIISCLFFPANLFSQQIPNPESEYLRIRSSAFEGNYDFAASAARKLVNEFPDYGDARILLGRILAWKKDYKQALAVIDTLLQKEPGNADALSARRDISQWSKGSTPVATDIRAGYSFDTFTEPNSRFWQVFNVGAGHRFGWGPAVAGINTGNISIGDSASIHKTEMQFIAEAWPTLTTKNYAYLAYAFSPGIYFPKHRAALEIWQMLPDGWAISAGLNYYYFTRNIFIAGLSVEKYISKYWFSAKGFVYFKDDGPTTSFFLNARRYFNNTDYLQVGIGAGTAPDEPFDVQTDLMRLSAYSFRLTCSINLTNKLTMRAGTGYSLEEHAEDIWRNRFEGNINFIYALKMK